jgi:LytS/YehU family sensor histidine kinase
MCLLFVGVAPLSWRVLFPDGFDRKGGAVRLLLYAIIGAGVVLTVGVAIPKLTGMGLTFLTDRYSLAVSGALFLVGGWGLGRDIGMEASLQKERRRAAALAREAELSQLLALRSHLDPHFLFNTLNAIAEWCRQDPEIAERAVLQLSDMLRGILAGVKSPSWPIHKELELMRTLFSLHQLRDPDLFTLDAQVDEKSLETHVPPMLLLPLAENAVKHGPSAGHRGTIRLTVRPEAGSRVRVEVENPGAYTGPRAGSDGLPTLMKRLELAYGGRARFDISGDASRTCAWLEVPEDYPS